MKGLLLHKIVILHLVKDFATRKSFNEHGFFVVVTSLNKIGEGRIRDLTGDVHFPMTFKCHIQGPSKGEILLEVMTQFSIYVEFKSTSMQLSGLFCISNYRPTLGVAILNTRLGLLNMVLSSSLNIREMMLQNVCRSPLRISIVSASVLFL